MHMCKCVLFASNQMHTCTHIATSKQSTRLVGSLLMDTYTCTCSKECISVLLLLLLCYHGYKAHAQCHVLCPWKSLVRVPTRRDTYM